MIVDFLAIKGTRRALEVKDPLSAQDANSRVRQYYNCLSIFLISSMGCALSLSRSLSLRAPATTWAQLEVQKVLKNMYLEIFERSWRKRTFRRQQTNFADTSNNTFIIVRIARSGDLLLWIMEFSIGNTKVPSTARLVFFSIVIVLKL